MPSFKWRLLFIAVAIGVFYLYATNPTVNSFQDYIRDKKNHEANPYSYHSYYLFSKFGDPNEEVKGYTTVTKFYIGIAGNIIPFGGEWRR